MCEIKRYPDFSWSLTRHKTLMDCPRKYGYEYYFSHKGWLCESSLLARQSYRLKKLINLPILTGQIVHNLIEDSIHTFQEFDYIMSPTEMDVRARAMLNSTIFDSKHRKELWVDRPNHYKMLFEFYYDGLLFEEDIEEFRNRIKMCFANYVNSKSLSDITLNSKTMRFLESEKFRYVEINGVRVFIVMDLIYKDIKNGKWIIVDWKTGRESSDDRYQLAIYAYYLMRQFNATLDEIEIRNEYLMNGNSRSYILSKTDIEKVLQLISESIFQMKKYQLDILSNEPVSLSDFEKTKEEKKCLKCNFREICFN